MLRENWPLIIYTILTQCAVGLCLFLALHLWFFTGGDAVNAVSTAQTGLYAACLLTALGMLLSSMHLGRPMRAYRAIINIKTSWLSREILATGLLFGLIVASCLAGLANMDATLYRLLLTATALAGILTILVMAFAYSKTAKAVWEGGRPLALFMASTIIMGAAGAAILAALTNATMPTNGIVVLAMCLSLSVIAMALSRNGGINNTKAALFGPALSLLGLMVIYLVLNCAALHNALPLLMAGGCAVLLGELTGRYGFIYLGLVEKPQTRIPLRFVLQDFISGISSTIASLRLTKDDAHWLASPRSYADESSDTYATDLDAAKGQTAKTGTVQKPREEIKIDPALQALLEKISVEDFFTTFLPEKSADILEALSSINLTFMAGKDFRCQFDIDNQVYSVILKGGTELDFISGVISKPHIVLKIAEKDWRDAITGKFNSVAQYYTGDITSLLDAKRYKAVVTLKGGLNLSLKMDDGRVLGITAIFNETSNPSVDLSLAMKDYLAVLSKTVSTQALIITNKVRFKGNMMLLLKFQNLL